MLCPSPGSPIIDSLAARLRAASALAPNEARQLLKHDGTYGAILRSLTAAGGPDWATPSPARRSLAEEYGKLLAQHFPLLLQATTIDSSANRYDEELLELMKFAAPAPGVRDVLAAEVARNPEFELKRNELLLHMRGFSQADQARVASSVKAATPEERGALLGFYADWGIGELSGHYVELLKVTPLPAEAYISKFGHFTEGEFHVSLRVAATAFSHLGPAPESVREQLRGLLGKYKADILGIQIETALRTALQISEGARPPLAKLASNGTGPINLSVNDKGR